VTDEQEANLIRWLQSSYTAVRKLPDGTFACIHPLMFTTSVILDCEWWGYGRRFCFESPGRAREVFDSLESADDEPTGWIARR
jgi:hypothetical protein